MKQERFDALIALLDDPNSTVFSTVQEEFLIHKDQKLIHQLEKASENLPDKSIQHRIDHLIHKIQLFDITKNIQSWAATKTQNLNKGFKLFNQFIDPGIDYSLVEAKLNQIAKETTYKFDSKASNLQKLMALNYILFDVYDYQVNLKDLLKPENFFANQMLKTHLGNQYSITMFYYLIAQKLKIHMILIDFPGNPLLAYCGRINKTQSRNQETLLPMIKFYISPAHNGGLIIPEEFKKLVSKLDIIEGEWQPSEISNKKVIKSLFSLLKDCYENEGSNEKTAELTKIIQVL